MSTHILHSIIETDQNVFPFISKKIGANLEMIKKINQKILEKLPKVNGGSIHLSKFSQKTISESINISKKMKDDYVSIDHIILGMITTNDDTSQLLKDNGFNTKDVNKIILEL